MRPGTPWSSSTSWAAASSASSRASTRPGRSVARPCWPRLRGLPELSRQALAGLTGLPDRPVAMLQLDTALAQLEGITELVDASLAEARLTRRGRRGRGAGRLPWRPQPGGARDALDAFRAGLDGDVRSRADGEGRLGPELFARKLRLTLGSDLSPDELRRRAWADYHAVRAEMLRLARETWPVWVPGEPLPDVAQGDADGEAALVKRVLDAIAAEHQQPGELIAYCQAEIDRIVGLLPRARRHQPARRAAHHHLDAGLPAGLRAGLPGQPGSARPRPEVALLDHPAGRVAGPGGGRVVPARGERPHAARPQHPRGHPGPLPAAGCLQPLPLAGAHGLHQRHVRRGLGRLRHAGHGRPRLRRRRPGLRADPLEALPARRRQRHPRRRDARRLR